MLLCTVIMAKPNSESIAVFNLQRQGYVPYWPRFKETKPDGGILIKPLFPRYLFVFYDKFWYSMRGTRGVSHVLMGNLGPVAVAPQVIDALKAKEDDKGFIQLGKQVPVEKFNKGQAVKAIEGAFTGLPLIYEGMSSKDRVKVLAEILGRQVLVEVQESSLVAS